MAYTVVFNPITLTNDMITLIISLHHLILLFYHSYYTFFCFTKTKPSNIQRLSILLVLINFLTVTNFSVITWNWYPFSWSCNWIMILSSILYLSSKVSLYVLISERLFFIFSDSEISFKSLYIWISRILFAVYWLIFSAMLTILGGGERGQRNCELRVPSLLLAVIAFGDIVICTLISTIFARKLLLLNIKLSATKPRIQMGSSLSSKSNSKSEASATKSKSTLTVSGDNTEPQRPAIVDIMYDIDVYDVTWKIVTKSTLLTIIAVITTPLSLILLVFLGIFGAAFVSMDSAVNCWCVVLMYTAHERIYNRLCKRMEKCVTIRCLSCWSCTCCNCCCYTKIQSNNTPNIKPNLQSVATESNNRSIQTDNSQNNSNVHV